MGIKVKSSHHAAIGMAIVIFIVSAIAVVAWKTPDEPASSESTPAAFQNDVPRLKPAESEAELKLFDRQVFRSSLRKTVARYAWPDGSALTSERLRAALQRQVFAERQREAVDVVFVYIYASEEDYRNDAAPLGWQRESAVSSVRSETKVNDEKLSDELSNDAIAGIPRRKAMTFFVAVVHAEDAISAKFDADKQWDERETAMKGARQRLRSEYGISEDQYATIITAGVQRGWPQQ